MNNEKINNVTAKDLIKTYNLQPHPEGGYYSEVYRSAIMLKQYALPALFKGDRNLATSIYFLLGANDFSAFHKIKSDETWHFYAGDALNIYVIDKAGNLNVTKLGSNVYNDEIFQFTVPAGCWFASKPDVLSTFSFVGCTVYPGFDFNDLKLAERSKLIKMFPQHSALITQLTR